MIGKIIIGKSYRKCISYCLSNKPGQNEPRAKILECNYVDGNKKEIIEQFEELGKMNPRLAKNVMHITLSWPPGEILSDGKLREIADECSQKLAFEKNQSIVIHHNDTKHQHIHIVVNRVGFDGKTLSDSNNYKKIADFCRAMERKFNLTPVLSPRKFLPKEIRDQARLDNRKINLSIAISSTLLRANSLEEFEKLMNAKGYEVVKGRGISFRDKQKVYTKGSQVGYSLTTIQDLLNSNTKTHSVLLKKNLNSALIAGKDLVSKNNRNILHNLMRKEVEPELSLLLPKKRKNKKRGYSI